jgi:hypothetical protein
MPTTTPNMALSIPVTDETNYPTTVSDSLTTVDSHDHSPGKGVLIPAEGLESDSVTTAKIVDGAVTTPKIADNAVTAAKIAAAAVGGGLTGGGGTAISIATGGVTAAKIGASAVETAKIADQNVTHAKLQAPNYVQGSTTTTSVTSTSETTVLTAPAITTQGRGVFVWVEGVTAGVLASFGSPSGTAVARIKRSGTTIASFELRVAGDASYTAQNLPFTRDYPPAGLHTYTMTIENSGATDTDIVSLRINAEEI